MEQLSDLEKRSGENWKQIYFLGFLHWSLKTWSKNKLIPRSHSYFPQVITSKPFRKSHQTISAQIISTSDFPSFSSLLLKARSSILVSAFVCVRESWSTVRTHKQKLRINIVQLCIIVGRKKILFPRQLLANIFECLSSIFECI